MLLLILYIMPLATNAEAFTGIPKGHALSDMAIPRCFAVASKTDKVGLGARLPTKPCKTLGFFPDNEVTRQVMLATAINGGLLEKDIIGFSDRAAFDAEQAKQLLLFGVEFTSPDFSSMTKSLEKM